MRTALDASGVNILSASGPGSEQPVPHLHFHVVPRWPDDRPIPSRATRTHASPKPWQATGPDKEHAETSMLALHLLQLDPHLRRPGVARSGMTPLGRRDARHIRFLSGIGALPRSSHREQAERNDRSET
ncbi:HIT family protein [Streptomyces sp. NPDC056367]|uniref:HIT family protein n=1 Tax=Streptomyces sp. NPDC056367 TaxID=3345797 RepID=UPI0035D77363